MCCEWLERVEIFLGKRRTLKLPIQHFSTSVILEDILSRSVDLWRNFSYVIIRMHSADNSRSKFVLYGGFFYDFYTLLIWRKVADRTDQRWILFPSMFHVHSDIIDEIFIEEFSEEFRISTIGIELYEESERFNLSDKSRESRLEGWFSSTDRYSIKESFSILDEGKKNFFPKKWVLDLFNSFGKDKIGIMTKTTPKIASRSKNHTRDFSRIINEWKFLESWNIHI